MERPLGLLVLLQLSDPSKTFVAGSFRMEGGEVKRGKGWKHSSSLCISGEAREGPELGTVPKELLST